MAPGWCGDEDGLGARPRSACGRGPMMLTSSHGNAVFLKEKWELFPKTKELFPLLNLAGMPMDSSAVCDDGITVLIMVYVYILYSVGGCVFAVVRATQNILK